MRPLFVLHYFCAPSSNISLLSPCKTKKIAADREKESEQTNGEEDDDEPLTRTRAICVGGRGKGEAFMLPVLFSFLFVI